MTLPLIAALIVVAVLVGVAVGIRLARRNRDPFQTCCCASWGETEIPKETTK